MTSWAVGPLPLPFCRGGLAPGWGCMVAGYCENRLALRVSQGDQGSASLKKKKKLSSEDS